MPKTKTDVAIRESAELQNLTAEELRNLTSPTELLEFYQAQGITPADITEYGDGFPILLGDEKKRLVGRAFHLIAWKEFESKKYNCPGIMAWVMTDKANPQTGEFERYRLVDLSTGICRQLREDIGTHRPMVVPNGLVRSEYDTEIEINGKSQEIHGVTYYLDTTPAA